MAPAVDGAASTVIQQLQSDPSRSCFASSPRDCEACALPQQSGSVPSPMHNSIPAATGDRWASTRPTARTDNTFMVNDLPMRNRIYSGPPLAVKEFRVPILNSTCDSPPLFPFRGLRGATHGARVMERWTPESAGSPCASLMTQSGNSPGNPGRFKLAQERRHSHSRQRATVRHRPLGAMNAGGPADRSIIRRPV